MKVNDEPIIVEQTFNASVDAVWRSITEPNLMRRWYFDKIPSFKAEVGFETQFNVKSQDRNFLHIWKVTEVVPMKKIAYDWKLENYPGDSSVMFELSEQDSLTLLRLTCYMRVIAPENITEFSRESCIGGWEYFIQQSLKAYLEKDAVNGV